MDLSESAHSAHSASVESATPVPSKLRRSCEACRSSKGRCLPSKDDPNCCAKCLKRRQKCVFLETKPRPKKMRSSRIRVTEMEQKLDGILNILAAKTQTESQPNPFSAPISPPETMSLDLSEIFELSYPSLPMEDAIPKPFQQISIPTTPHFGFRDFQDTISKGVVNIKQAEEALEEFAGKASAFPFVLLPPHTSLESLRHERPALLLAILASTCQNNIPIQNILENELLETLSSRIIMQGEKSIDLLQSLLLYLAWYHYHYSPAKDNLYQLTQMANAMVIDLGLHRPKLGANQTSYSNILGFECPTGLTPVQIEERRTLVGCFCLTSSLKYHDYIEECGQVLSEVSVAETDRLLPFFTRIHRLGEEVSDAFDYSNHGQLAKLDSVRIEIFNRSFAQQFQDIQRYFPQEAWNNTVLRASYAHLRIYVTEISLHAVPSDVDRFTTNTPSIRTSWYDSPTRAEMLIRCLQAGKDFLDTILSLTALEFGRLTAPNYIDCFYVLLLLGKFTQGCESPSLDGEQVRQAANLRYYLDALDEKLAALLVYNNGQVQRNNIWNMKLLCHEINRWYTQIVSVAPGSDQAMLGSLNISFTDIVPSIQDLCGEVLDSFAYLKPGECPSPNMMGVLMAFMAAGRNVTTEERC
ncbi:hypothetical protein SBOR_4338 [Sclerotinia borealis F-4128]|uniref:Zn(2)-C6 fungal-type domain-containing protein n=1 Tax=Sclerotinia borealis (strain F-4128) TaxID=1432307 RepID=W9CKW3_SCLBF|nr:hypothetical protein SBOR_4338 [Sclerotinia borealis F-4128]